MKLLEIYSSLKQDISYIESELEKSVRTDHQTLSETSLHLLRAGGKRLRPVIVLLSAHFGQYDIKRIKNVAVPLELIHMATLVHDDVIDDADTRRGQLTVKSKWDNRIAMYTGDYIFAQALIVASQLNNPQIHRILSKAIVQMCIGEMEQIRYFFRTDQTVRNYLLRIRRKTALLIAISCQLGAIASNAPDSACRQLYSFGYNVGMAFQIRDDILDINGTEKQLGKPPGSDIKQGNITLPVLLALEDPIQKAEIIGELNKIRESDGIANAAHLLKVIRQSNGLQRAEVLANQYIEKAIRSIKDLPNLKAKQDLVEIAYFVGNRSY